MFNLYLILIIYWIIFWIYLNNITNINILLKKYYYLLNLINNNFNNNKKLFNFTYKEQNKWLNNLIPLYLILLC